MNISRLMRSPLQPTDALRACLAWTFSLWVACCGASSSALADDRQFKSENAKPEEIFRHSCAVCHGERGNGQGRASNNLNPRPRDFTQSSNLTREAMINAVTYGRPGTAMMSWTRKYSPQQIEGVVDYIRGRFMLVALDPHIETGRAVYGHFCQVCHGDRGQGVKSAADTPRDWTVPKVIMNFTRERMIAAVAQGKHGATVSAGFSDKLSADQMSASVDYIRRVLLPALAERDQDKSPPTAAQPASPSPQQNAPLPAAKSASAQADMSLPLPKGLVGDIKRGEKFFMGNCATCHGKLGNGEGPRAFFLNPSPRNFHDAYSHTNLNRPTLFSVITTGKPGTVMPAWGKVLSEQEIANVAEFVFQTFVQAKN
ncbi:MAG: c-type cytochrome [Gammaproteobacteria bacterium]|nr:c-type cytochrome [Gammaproteobacteria bacterium]